MSKNKKTLEPIKNPDVTNTDPAYWEMVLESYGLGMGRGKHAQKYIGRGSDIDRLNERQYRRGTGKVEPRGHGADDENH